MLVIPVYNRLLVPYAKLYFQADEIRTQAGRDVGMGEEVILLQQKEDKERNELTAEDLYPIGVAGEIAEINVQGFVVVRTVGRVNIDNVEIDDSHAIALTVSARPDVEDLGPDQARARFDAIRQKMESFTEQIQGGEWLKAMVGQMHSVGEVAAVFGVWFNISNEDRYAMLAEDSVAKRTDLMARALEENIEVARVAGEANATQQAEDQNRYREQALKKQIDYLQKQLDDMHPENMTDARKFEKAIAESGMNEDAKREATKVLNRLKNEGKDSPEYGMLYDYLDFVTTLSWKKEEAQHINLDEAQQILDEDHYGLKKVKQRIIQQIAVMNLKGQQSGSILLFVGAPGTGKTSIGRSIARALHRKYVRVSLGGVRDEADIRGHRRTYIGAMAGRIMDGIHKSGVSNPVMVLDEVDKLSSSYNGDPASALLEVLDPEQNSTFTDHYMNVPYDLSNVMFICTANTTDTIPEPLLNRMEVIQFQGYTPAEKLRIAKEHLLPKSMKDTGIEDGELEVSDDVLSAIISGYTMEAGVRGLRKRIDTLCRNAAVEIEKRNEKLALLTDGQNALSGAKNDVPTTENPAPESAPAPFVVNEEDLHRILDMHPVHHDEALKANKPGVVTGLAWTQVGGEILYIESLFTKGKGQLILTGKLGDVMKESIQIAVSLVKSLYPDKSDLFEKNDLHIHVPEGAVPKDGPSAGITMTTTIASLVTGKAVPPTVGMTGEVSLRGAVTPIGGLPEKLMAADRAGLKTIFIPKDNVQDLEDVAPEVKEHLTIIPVEKVTDVLTKLELLAPDKAEAEA